METTISGYDGRERSFIYKFISPQCMDRLLSAQAILIGFPVITRFEELSIIGIIWFVIGKFIQSAFRACLFLFSGTVNG